MSVYSKTIHILNQKNEVLKRELASEETKIGFLYLDDAACSEEEQMCHNKLKTELQQLMATVSEINSLENKRKELLHDIQNVKAELAELVTKESGLMLTLGIALYGQSSAASVPSFQKFYEEASGYAEKITSLKTQSEQMTESLELQNVFNRVVTKVKISSLSISINSQQKKLDATLIAGAKAVVEAQDLGEDLRCPAYDTCIAFKNDWNKARIRLEALQDELQNVDVTLADYGRKSLVQEKADAKNAEIEAFAFQTGHAFDKKYITRDGDTLADFPEKYADGLSVVLNLRAKLASVNRRLDILQYSEQIDAANHAREAMEKEVASNEEKIKKLQSRNIELAHRLDENSAAADDLCAHREAVEKEEGITLENLLSIEETEIVKPVEKAADFVKQAGMTLKKVAAAAEKGTSQTAEAMKKTAGRKKAAVAKAEDADFVAVEDDSDEEAEFLQALNAAKASAAQDSKKAEDTN